jgi:hypothetical protein
MSGLNVPVTFAPATNDKEIAMSATGMCGDRDYTILEAQPASFISIASPAPADPYTTNWTLNCQSSNLADV